VTGASWSSPANGAGGRVSPLRSATGTRDGQRQASPLQAACLGVPIIPFETP
jgi:hypothetical protein